MNWNFDSFKKLIHQKNAKFSIWVIKNFQLFKDALRPGQSMMETVRRTMQSFYWKSLKVSIENEVILSDSLQHEVKADETTWTLEKGKTLTINLSKSGEIWWSKLLENEGEMLDSTFWK